MNKKLFCLVLVGMLMGLVGSVGAANITWDDGEPADHLWSSPANWSGDTLPSALDRVYIDASPALPRTVLDATIFSVNAGGAFTERLYVGNTKIGDLLITGGAKLTTADDLNLAYAAGSTGVVTIDGSGTIVNVAGGLKVGRYGNGTLVMNDGTINVTKELDIPSSVNNPGNRSGLLQLFGGTINANNLSMGEGAAVVTAAMDVTGGTLILNTDRVAKVQGYITNGWITAYGGLGTLQLDFDVTNSGKTTLTAIIPEPATMVLLGLGSLALYRRKKN